jgi:signal transduction histidine kinase
MSDNSQILEQLTQTELFKSMSDICTAVNKSTNAHDLLEISLKLTMDLFKAQRGSIFLLKENGNDLILKIALGMAVGEQKNLVKRMGEGVVGKVAASKKPIFVEDIARDERFINYKARRGYRTPSFICAPLLIKDTLIGVINITDKEGERRFSPNELQLLDFLASQIALNYRRIQLYQKFKTIVKESQSLKDELGKSSKEARHLKKQVVLHEKLASIGKLAGGIAHEFNNPLDGVIRYTNLCLEHVREDEVVRGYLLEIKQGLNRMANIVRSLLACSRNVSPTMQRIHVNNALEQALLFLQGELTLKSIKVIKQYGDDLPEITDLGLERVFSNLLRNSIDAIEEEGEITIITRFKDGKIKIRIKDNGKGITPDSVEKIFEPFYTTKDIDKGCGLGLTIVTEIIKSYNGDIKVVSEEGLGASFTVSIPTNEPINEAS